VGHPASVFTQLPARDARSEGGLTRSSRHPNSSFYTSWKTTNDAIIWDVDVLEGGDFAVELYYTCPAADLGSEVQLSMGENRLTARITEAHDPPLQGMEHDRVPRIESYVKVFKPLKMGQIHLDKGIGQLSLRALSIPGSQVMDFRLLMLRRIR
jgi:hypothetical protein